MAETARHIVMRCAFGAAIVLSLAFPAIALVQPAYADQEHSAVAPASQMASSKALLLEGMRPITAGQVKDGVYEIEAESSSPFFKIQSATLTVKDGAMTAAIGVDSKTYPLVYLGTGAQAAAAPAGDYIEFDGDAWTFTIPVAALDAEIDCAAWSKRRSQWYDRTILFRAASLPADALLVELPEYGDPVESADAHTDAHTDASAGANANATKTSEGTSSDAAPDDHGAVALNLPDGEYSIEVNMTGGSGRASVSSPTWLVVRDGHAYARLLWSSSYYDYMIVDEERYDNQTDDGSNSTFVIPITVMDDEMDVVADTTAMGDPLEIDYHLTFYSDTIGDKDAIPQEAAIKVLYIALAVIVVGGILNHVLKKRRKR